MRIGLFSDAYYPDINGVVSSVATLKDALEKLGHTVFVISNHKGTNIDYSDHILRLPGIELKKFYGYKLSSPIQFKGAEYIHEMNLDIIHINTEAGIGMFARLMAKQCQIPIVYTYHTMYEDYTHYLNPLDIELVDEGEKLIIRKFSKYWVNHSEAVIAPSQKTKNRLLEYGATSPIFVVPTGLDLSHFDRSKLDPSILASIRSSLNLTKDDHVVTFVGRIAKEKAIDIPIKALSLCKDQSIHLVIVGKGTDLEFYQNLAKELKVDDRVHFTGMIDKPMVPYYYSAFDCFVSASTSETQGMTYIEALASGLCIFGRRDEVLEELIEEGTTGYYFDDEQELAKKFDEFFTKPKEIREATSQQCIEKTLSYDTETFGKSILNVYEYALNQYQKQYKIIRVANSDDFVNITFEREGQESTLLVPFEDYIDLQMSIDSIIDIDLYNNYLELQSIYTAYLKAKKHILKIDCCTYTVQQYCKRNLNLNDEDSDVIVHMLQHNLLLDDRLYAIEKANYWQHTGKSINDIASKLRSFHISEDFIQEAISKLDKDKDRENAVVFMNKICQQSKNSQSLSLFQKTAIRKCMYAGFSYEDAQYALDQIEFKEDFDEASLEQSIQKANRMYARFEDSTRLYKIRMYCIRKGFSSDNIDRKLKELEND